MAGFVWKRAHTITAGSLAVVLAGLGTAVALTSADPPSTAPAPTAVSASPTATPTPTPSPKPPPTTPDPTDPLTGGKPSDNAVLAVKVENIAAARPQLGLGAADIVFVEEVEGRLTRLVAVYHTRFPKRVGPVRSARNTDVELLPVFGRPGLVYSGANRKVQRNIEGSRIVPLPRGDRDGSRVAPHNVVVDLAEVASSAQKLGEPRPIGWTFAASDARWAAADRDSEATGRVGGDSWSFTTKGDRYVVRWNGATYADGDSGTVATTDNVVVMSVKNAPDGNADVNGARSVKSATVGRGKVVIYRDGRTLTGRWTRSAATEPLRFVDGDGRDIALKPGRTWVLLSG